MFGLRCSSFITTRREEFLAHYHKRSNVESVFQMIKSKFGERLRSKTETAQVNEALTKVLAHNLCVVIQSMYELNITPEFCSEAAYLLTTLGRERGEPSHLSLRG